MFSSPSKLVTPVRSNPSRRRGSTPTSMSLLPPAWSLRAYRSNITMPLVVMDSRPRKPKMTTAFLAPSTAGKKGFEASDSGEEGVPLGVQSRHLVAWQSNRYTLLFESAICPRTILTSRTWLEDE